MRPVLGAIFMAVALVAGGLGVNWSGERTEGRVYLKPMPVADAALLVEEGKAALLPVDAGTEALITNYQVFPAREADPPELVVTRNGGRFWLAKVAHGGVFVRHHVPRKELAAALGAADLAAREAVPAAVPEPVTATDLVWLYALVEVSLLTAFFTSLYGVFRLVRTRWLLAPALLACLAAFAASVHVYEPAFFPLDRLRHRIVVDTLAPSLLGLAMPLIAVTMFSLVGYGARAAAWAIGLTAPRFQRAAGWLTVLLAIAAGLVHYGIVRTRAETTVADLARSVQWPDSADFADELASLRGADGEARALTVGELPPLTRAFTEQTLARMTAARGETLLLVRVDAFSAFFIAKGPDGAAIGVRPVVQDEPTRRVLDSGAVVASGAFAFFKGLFLHGSTAFVAGQPVPDSRGRLAAAAVFEAEAGWGRRLKSVF